MCAMEKRIQEMIEDVEEKSYNKLVKQLKAKGLHYFETPLVVNDEHNIE